MRTNQRPDISFRPSLAFILLTALLAALWLAGGASRADALGQAVARGAAWFLLVVAILFADRSSIREAKPILVMLLAAAALAAVQIIPLPPSVWQALPGREILAEAMAASGQPQPWRPWAIVPDAAANALSSLIVPLAVLLLLAGLKENERQWLPGLVLGLIVASTLLGMLQFSGAMFDNPFINDSSGEVSGSFANRNHMALFVAFGCMAVPVWAFLDGRRPGWRTPVALGLMVLFVVTILVIGSRAGLVLGALALGLSLLLAWQGMRRELSRMPRWVFPALIGAIVVAVALFVLVSIAADRAVAVSRMFAPDKVSDLRLRGLPTVMAMIREYFPFGSGLGGFDPVFRMHEPLALLQPTYFNHAHNDFLEIALDTGLAGMLLLGGALAWWVWASVRAWRAGASPRHGLPKLGSAMLLLVIVASIFDYPARTPMIMAIMIIAAFWLNGARKEHRASALPEAGAHL